MLTGVQFAGTDVTPNGIPIRVVTKIPIRIEPGILSAYKTAVRARPIIATAAGPCVKLPKPTKVASLFTIMPAF